MSKTLFLGKTKGVILVGAVLFLTILLSFISVTETAGQNRPVERVGACIRVDHSTVTRGGKLSVTGAGFLPNEAVSLEAIALWKGFDIAVGDIYKCNKSGAFNAIVKLPSHKRVNLGLHTLQAFGSKGSVASVDFTVAAEVMNPQHTAVVIVTPNEVVPKEKVTVLGSGFAPKEQVSFELIGAWAGYPIAVGPLVTCNDYGAFMAEDVTIINRKSFGVFTLKAIGSEGTSATSPIIISKKK